jgi:hypothetical protein
VVRGFTGPWAVNPTQANRFKILAGESGKRIVILKADAEEAESAERRAGGFALLLTPDCAEAFGSRHGAGGQGVLYNCGLLLLVPLAGTGGGAGAFGAAYVAEIAARGIEQRLELIPYEVPGAHVARLFLGPDHFGRGRVGGQDLGGLGGGERVELLDAHQRDGAGVALFAG